MDHVVLNYHLYISGNNTRTGRVTGTHTHMRTRMNKQESAGAHRRVSPAAAERQNFHFAAFLLPLQHSVYAGARGQEQEIRRGQAKGRQKREKACVTK